MSAERPFDEGMVADDDVDQPVGSEHGGVGTMFAHVTFELEEGFDFLGLAVAVGVAQAVEGRAAGPAADGEDVVAPSQDALAVLHLVAIRADRFELAVMVLVLDQQQRPLFLGSDDRAGFVEAHGHQRTGRAGDDDFLHLEARPAG